MVDENVWDDPMKYRSVLVNQPSYKFWWTIQHNHCNASLKLLIMCTKKEVALISL
jgi:hypothetical protein